MTAPITKTMGVKFDVEIHKKYEDMAKKTGRSKAFFVRKALLDFLEQNYEAVMTSEGLW